MLSKTDLTTKQNAAIEFAYENDYALMQCAMGFGKTIVTLTTVDELIRDGHLSRVLIIAPLRVCDLTWRNEKAKWTHLNVSVAIATGTPKQRLAAFESDAQVVVINFENIKWLFSNQHLIEKFDGLVIDETSKAKNVSGIAVKQLRHRVKNFKWRLGLTGTLVEEGLPNLYAMALLLDGGKSLGRNKEVFMRKYFYPTDYSNYNWAAFTDTWDRLAALIAPFTFIADADAADTPPVVTRFVYVDLTTEAREAYATISKDLLLELEGADIVASNMAVRSGKLQQLTNGFMYDEEGEAVVFHTEKLAAAREEIARAKADRAGLMIVYQHTWELEALRGYLGEDCGVMGDGVSKKEAARIEREWNARRLNVLLVHPKSAGHGLNLQFGGSRVLFFAPIWSRDQTDQVIARLARRGQPDDYVEVSYLVGRDTIDDEVIIPRVEGKGDNAERFAAHLRAAIG